ncbi:high mobility group protein, partial [Magnaporthiopsis poae ATCC 64411]
MARPPKNKAPAADNVVASSSMPPPPRQIDVEGFVRVRDSGQYCSSTTACAALSSAHFPRPPYSLPLSPISPPSDRARLCHPAAPDPQRGPAAFPHNTRAVEKDAAMPTNCLRALVHTTTRQVRHGPRGRQHHPSTCIAFPGHVLVYSRLVSIQNLLQQFSGDYLRQTNLLLGFGDGPLDNAVEFGGLEGMVNLLPATGLVPMPAEEPKKERKKRHHDPNAPKRPLTPYFLYMQTARPIIAADLGSDAAKGAVQEEGQRRWGTMSQAEKAGWDQAYQYNLRLYNARVHSYKHGNLEAKEMSDEDAQQYAEQHSIPMPTGKDVAAAAAVEIGNDQDAIAQQLQGA